MARRNRVRRWFSNQPLRLEDRIAPAVFTAFDRASGQLTVSCDADDAIVLATAPDGSLSLNGVAIKIEISGVIISSADIAAITVTGSDFNNFIDVSGLVGDFASDVCCMKWDPLAFRVVIKAGGGDDVIIGSNYDDLIYGGAGADSSFGGAGNDYFADVWADLTSDLVIDGGTGSNALVPGIKGGGVFGVTIAPDSGACSFSWGASNPVSTVNVGSGIITGDEDCDGTVDDPDISDVRLKVASSSSGYLMKGVIRDGRVVDLSFDSGGGGTPPPPVNRWSFGASDAGSWTLGAGGGAGRIGKISVTGTPGNDIFNVEPGASGVAVNGAEGFDVVSVNTFGLPFTQTTDSVSVSGKSSVSVLNAESVLPGVTFTGAAADYFLKIKGISAELVLPPGPFLPGSTVPVSVSITNNSPTPVESVSLNFTKIEMKYHSASDGVTARTTVAPVDSSLVDQAAGRAPRGGDVTFELETLPAGKTMTASFLAVMPPDGSSLDVTGSLSLSTATGTHIKGAELHRIAHGTHIKHATIVYRSSVPAGQAPTLVGATATNEPLFLLDGAGTDPTVVTVTPGKHLYLNGFMIDVAFDGKTSGNAPVSQASVDFSGSVVAFISSATNLLPPGQLDANGFADLFVSSSVSSSTDSQRSMRPVRISAPGAEPNGACRNPRVTGDGRFVFFESKATNLDSSVTDTNNDWDLFACDLTTMSVRCVSIVPSGLSTANKGVLTWDVSDNGDTVAWITEATDAGSGGGGGSAGGALAVVKKKKGSTTKLTQIEIEAFSWGVSQSGMRVAGDGSVVVIGTDAPLSSLLSVPDNNGAFDLLLVDAETGKLGCASLNATGMATGNGASYAADISFDGKHVSFLTSATDLSSGPNPAGTSVAIRRIKADMYCEDVRFQYSPSATFQRIAGDGQSVVFNSKTDFRSSGAPDLTVRNLWSMDLHSPLVSLVSQSTKGTPVSTEDCDDAAKFHSGAVMFTTSEPLDPDSDDDSFSDIYVSTAHVSFFYKYDKASSVIFKRSSSTGDFEVFDPATGTTLATRPASATRFVRVTGNDGVAEEFGVDLSSGLTRLSSVTVSGGTGAGDSIRLLSAPTASVSVTGFDSASPGSFALGKVGSNASTGLKDTLKTRVRVFSSGVEDVFDETGASDVVIQALPPTGAGQSVSLAAGSGSGAGKVSMQDFHFTMIHQKVKFLDLIGSPGNDTFTVSGSGFPTGQRMRLFAGPGNDVMSAAALSQPVPVVLDGGTGDNTITGNGLSSTLVCGQGNDEVFPGIADITDVFIPSASIYTLTVRGSDFGPVSFARCEFPVALDLDSTSAQPLGSFGGSITFDSRVRACVGSPYDDSFACDLVPAVHRSVDGGGQVAGGTGDALTVDGGGVPTTVRRCGPGDSVPEVACPSPFYFLSMPPVGSPPAGRVDFGGIESPFATNAGSPAAPAVVVNGGGTQRSRVTGLVVPFNFAAEFTGDPASLLQITDKTGSPVPFSVELLQLGGLATAYVSFTGTNLQAGSLPDGRYTVSLPGSSVVGGLPGGDFQTTFHRLFGDADGDATVTVSDFLAFRLAFLSNNFAFDFDGSGTVGSADFLQFRLRFLQSV
jgi:hypothetical protein